jgi:hypothetical protein
MVSQRVFIWVWTRVYLFDWMWLCTRVRIRLMTPGETGTQCGEKRGETGTQYELDSHARESRESQSSGQLTADD